MKLVHNSERCIGCKACQVACCDIHNLPAGKLLMEIAEEETFAEGIVKVRYVMRPCRGCTDRVCVSACPMECITAE